MSPQQDTFSAQVLRWSQCSLAELCAARPGAFVLDAAVLERWDGAWLRGVDAAAWTRAAVGWLHTHHQFLVIDAAAVEAEIQRALVRAVAEPAAAVEAVRVMLAGVVRAQLGDQPIEVMCSEYSAKLQLQVLGLKLEDVRGPALDVGCGAAAALVEVLKASGVAAEGIDRVRGDDWLAFNYGVDRWATVVSHHGLTLHFLHHHTRPGNTALVYAQVYMAVLRSLQVGGVFAYAPGLPFIEAMLPAAVYRCVRVSLPAEVEAALRALNVPAIGHATQVWRRT